MRSSHEIARISELIFNDIRAIRGSAVLFSSADMSTEQLVPKRTDIETILILGSGPIVIGQACEFDYSGTQACRVLKSLGYRIVLVNSNPATIMTDPELADRTYIEPLTPEILAQIIEREKPQALLPTMGGQTSLNLAYALHENGVLAAHHVELIGARFEAIKKAESRELFAAACAASDWKCRAAASCAVSKRPWP